MQPKLNTPCVLLFFIPFALSCSSKTKLTEKDVAAIRNLDKSYVELSVNHKWDSLLLLFSNDIILFPANDTAVIGHSANLKRFTGFGNIPIEYSHQITSIDGSKDLAYLHGSYSIRIIFPNNTIPYVDNGKYLWVLKKESDNWKIHRVIWNSNVPVKSAS